MEMIGALVGGLGLFLLAVGMITDGLKAASGDALRDLLGNWTRTPLRGIGAGALITGVVQSSSAVTVATIGFVNANLLTMQQALGVVYGANIGTTMTGWLVAAVGFKFKVEIFALPMIGVGMFLRVLGGGSRKGAIGTALAGFGLFFIGIDILRGGFEGLAQGIDLARFQGDSLAGLLLYVLVGIFMTVVTQSSSAAIAITLTAATGGLVPVPAAAAMVIGANLGTTSTAVFAALGATPNAKRVAAAHIIFNLVTGVVALLLLPLLLWVVGSAARLLANEAAPAVFLALFHTAFNIMGVMLMWPFTARLGAFLKRRFVSQAENLGRPRYIDATTAGSPALAVDAMRLELQRMLELLRRLQLSVLDGSATPSGSRGLQQAIDSLATAIEDAVLHLERSQQGAGDTAALAVVLRSTRRLRDAAESATAASVQAIDAPQARAFLNTATLLLGEWQPERHPFPEPLSHHYHQLALVYEQARADILVATAGGQFAPARAHLLLDQLRAVYRALEQSGKAARQIEEELPPAMLSREADEEGGNLAAAA